MSKDNDDLLRAIVARQEAHVLVTEQSRLERDHRERQRIARQTLVRERWAIADQMMNAAIADLNSRIGVHLVFRRLQNRGGSALLAEFSVILDMNADASRNELAFKVSHDGDMQVEKHIGSTLISAEGGRALSFDVTELRAEDVEKLLIDFLDEAVPK